MAISIVITLTNRGDVEACAIATGWAAELPGGSVNPVSASTYLQQKIVAWCQERVGDKAGVDIRATLITAMKDAKDRAIRQLGIS